MAWTPPKNALVTEEDKWTPPASALVSAPKKPKPQKPFLQNLKESFTEALGAGGGIGFVPSTPLPKEAKPTEQSRAMERGMLAEIAMPVVKMVENFPAATARLGTVLSYGHSEQQKKLIEQEKKLRKKYAAEPVGQLRQSLERASADAVKAGLPPVTQFGYKMLGEIAPITAIGLPGALVDAGVSSVLISRGVPKLVAKYATGLPTSYVTGMLFGYSQGETDKKKLEDYGKAFAGFHGAFTTLGAAAGAAVPGPRLGDLGMDFGNVKIPKNFKRTNMEIRESGKPSPKALNEQQYRMKTMLEAEGVNVGDNPTPAELNAAYTKFKKSLPKKPAKAQESPFFDLEKAQEKAQAEKELTDLAPDIFGEGGFIGGKRRYRAFGEEKPALSRVSDLFAALANGAKNPTAMQDALERVFVTEGATLKRIDPTGELYARHRTKSRFQAQANDWLVHGRPDVPDGAEYSISHVFEPTSGKVRDLSTAKGDPIKVPLTELAKKRTLWIQQEYQRDAHGRAISAKEVAGKADSDAIYSQLSPEDRAAVDETVTRIQTTAQKPLNVAVEKELVGPADAAAMKAADPYHVSTFRDFSDYADQVTYGGKGANLKKRAAGGSEADIKDIIASNNRNLGNMNQLAELNALKRDIIDTALKDPDMSRHITQVQTVQPGMNRVIDMEHGVRFMKPKTSNPNQHSIARVDPETGRAVWETYEISNTDFNIALQDASGARGRLLQNFLGKAGSIVDVFDSIRQFQQRNVTASPGFIARNVVKDVPSSLIVDPTVRVHQLPQEIAKTGVGFFRAFVDAMLGTGSMKKARSLGLVDTGFYGGANPNPETLEGEIVNSSLVSKIARYANPLNWMGAWERGLPRASEITNRLARAQRALNKTGNDEDFVNAFMSGAAPNYTERGTAAKLVGPLSPFTSSAAAGGRFELQALMDDPIGFVSKATALYTVPGLLNYERVKDKDWFQAAPTWQKISMIPIGEKNGKIIWAPTPFGIGSMFYGIPIMIRERMEHNSPGIARETLKAAVGAYLPSVDLPGKVIMNLKSGKEWMGRDIIPKEQQRLPVDLQDWTVLPASSNLVTKLVNKILPDRYDISPYEADYVYRYYAKFPREVELAIEQATRRDEGEGVPVKYPVTNALGLKTVIAEHPMYTGSNAYMERFFDIKPFLGVAAVGYAKQKKDYLEGNISEEERANFLKYEEEHKTLINAYEETMGNKSRLFTELFGTPSDERGGLFGKIRRIKDKSTKEYRNLSGEEKYALMSETYYKINTKIKDALDRFDYKTDGAYR